jgi:hypothetical protein
MYGLGDTIHQNVKAASGMEAAYFGSASGINQGFSLAIFSAIFHNAKVQSIINATTIILKIVSNKFDFLSIVIPPFYSVIHTRKEISIMHFYNQRR